MPPVGLSQTPKGAGSHVETERESGNVSSRGTKEPERRHSFYNSASRGQYQQKNGPRTSSGGEPQKGKDFSISAMNVNGLPDPYMNPLSRPPSSSEIHNIPRQDLPRTRHSGAGTPQFRNLAGIQFPVPRSSRYRSNAKKITLNF